jgi:hypothetical protein
MTRYSQKSLTTRQDSLTTTVRTPSGDLKRHVRLYEALTIRGLARTQLPKPGTDDEKMYAETAADRLATFTSREFTYDEALSRAIVLAGECDVKAHTLDGVEIAGAEYVVEVLKRIQESRASDTAGDSAQ